MGEVVHVAATRLVCKRREHVCVGHEQEVPYKKNGGLGSGSGGIMFHKRATQCSNVCHRTATAETQLLEHSGESGLDHENGLLL